MRHLNKIVDSLNEAKSNLLNQIDHLQNTSLGSKAYRELILSKRKALLSIEVKIHKAHDQYLKLKSKKKS